MIVGVPMIRTLICLLLLVAPAYADAMLSLPPEAQAQKSALMRAFFDGYLEQGLSIEKAWDATFKDPEFNKRVQAIEKPYWESY